MLSSALYPAASYQLLRISKYQPSVSTLYKRPLQNLIIYLCCILFLFVIFFLEWLVTCVLVPSQLGCSVWVISLGCIPFTLKCFRSTTCSFLSSSTWLSSLKLHHNNIPKILIPLLRYTLFAFWNKNIKFNILFQIARWGALVCGLALSNQHTSVIYVAVIACWVLYTLFTLKVNNTNYSLFFLIFAIN